MSMPPVMTCASPSATDSVPSVTISAGTLATATSTPLTTPHTMPLTIAATSPTTATPIPLPPITSISFAATTDENTNTEPTDRSMPEVMITNVIPTPRTAQTATFCEMSEKLPVDRKRSPAITAKNRQITIRTPRIQNAWSPTTRFSSDWAPSNSSALSATAACWLATVLMRDPPSLLARHSRRAFLRVESPGHGAHERLDRRGVARVSSDPPAEAQHLDAIAHLQHVWHRVADEHNRD